MVQSLAGITFHFDFISVTTLPVATTRNISIIQWSCTARCHRRLQDVRPVTQKNGYWGHPEQFLLCIIIASDREVRERGVELILSARCGTLRPVRFARSAFQQFISTRQNLPFSSTWAPAVTSRQRSLHFTTTNVRKISAPVWTSYHNFQHSPSTHGWWNEPCGQWQKHLQQSEERIPDMNSSYLYSSIAEQSRAHILRMACAEKRLWNIQKMSDWQR